MHQSPRSEVKHCFGFLKTLVKTVAVIGNLGKVILLSTITGVLVGGCGGGGGSNTPALSTLSGVSAVGFPIVGGNVSIICAAGSPLVTTTNNAGGWQATITDQTLPCAVQVSGGIINNVPNTTAYHSIALSLGTVNVTPLTDLMVAHLTATATPDTWFGGLSANQAVLSNISQANVDTTLTALRTALSGLWPLSAVNPITTVFAPVAGNGIDDMLTAMASAMISASVTYPSLQTSASQSGFTAPAGFNTALTSAYSITQSSIGTVILSGTGAARTGKFFTPTFISTSSPSKVEWTGLASHLPLVKIAYDASGSVPILVIGVIESSVGVNTSYVASGYLSIAGVTVVNATNTITFSNVVLSNTTMTGETITLNGTLSSLPTP